MLKVLRESAIERPWFYRTIMIFIAVVFVVTMGWWGFEQNKEDVIISVGEDRVSRDEYQRAYRIAYDNYRMYKERGLISDDIPDEQLKDQLKPMVVEDLIQSHLWMQAAREMGVLVTANEVRDSIMKIQAFQTNGKFDPELYKRLLAQNRLTPELFESAQRAELVREKARMLVRESVAPTADELSEVQAMLAAQPMPTVPMQATPAPDRAFQAVLMQKQQRAMMAYQEALKSRTKIGVHRELL